MYVIPVKTGILMSPVSTFSIKPYACYRFKNRSRLRRDEDDDIAQKIIFV